LSIWPLRPENFPEVEKGKIAMTRSPLDALVDEYAAWNRAQNLNLGSADEHLYDSDLTQAQRDWLRGFCWRWEKAERPSERERRLGRQVTETFEPLRPLYAPENGDAVYVDAIASGGAPRVDYGEQDWASRSYWRVPIADDAS
jgi:hypothetical protein